LIEGKAVLTHQFSANKENFPQEKIMLEYYFDEEGHDLKIQSKFQDSLK